MTPPRIELGTYSLEGCCSIQLSYGAFIFSCSNTAYPYFALPNAIPSVADSGIPGNPKERGTLKVVTAHIVHGPFWTKAVAPHPIQTYPTLRAVERSAHLTHTYQGRRGIQPVPTKPVSQGEVGIELRGLAFVLPEYILSRLRTAQCEVVGS